MLIINENKIEKLPKSILNEINISMNLINIFYDFEDDYFSNWSFLIFPLFNALEGYIKWKLNSLGIEIDKSFYCFSKNKDKYEFNEKVKLLKKHKDTYLTVEKCYNIYVNYRHRYFHLSFNFLMYDKFTIKNKQKVIEIFIEVYNSIIECEVK